jgi:hypothetical protein
MKLFKAVAGVSKQLALSNCEAKFLAAVHYVFQTGSVGAASGFSAGSVYTCGSAGHDKRLRQATSHNMVSNKDPGEDISTTDRVNHV